MSSEEWAIEDAMARLLDELTEIQAGLLDVLRRKRAAMTVGDLDAQRNLQQDEEGIYRALEGVQTRRGELLVRIRQVGVEAESLTEAADRLPLRSHDEVHRKLGEATKLGRTVRLEQLTNWVAAQRSLLHVSQMLEIIATGGRIRPTYGKSEFAYRGSLVDHEA